MDPTPRAELPALALVGRLVAVTAALWAIVAVPAGVVAGPPGVAQATGAALLCLGPAALTLGATLWLRRSPEEQLLAVAFGIGCRVVLVIAGGLYLQKGLPESAAFDDPLAGLLAGPRETLLNRPSDRTFWVWVVLFYLFTLAAEVVLTAARDTRRVRAATDNPNG